MARDHGRILHRLWTDPEFVQFTANAQRMYKLVLSQPTLSHAGVAPYTVRRWAGLAIDTSDEDVRRGVKELEASAYLIVDEDTEEVFVRSYVRNDNVLGNPNVAIAAVRAYEQIASPRIKARWRAELQRLWEESKQVDVPAKAWTDDRSSKELAKVLKDRRPDPPNNRTDQPEQPPLEGGCEPLPEPPPKPLPGGGNSGGVPTRTRTTRAALAPSPSPNTLPPPVEPPPPSASPQQSERTRSNPPPSFDDFWAIYPLKTAKPKALKSWTAAIKAGADPAAIVVAAAAYRDNPHRQASEPRFTAHPATWLNNERWNDQPPDSGEPPTSPVAAEIERLRTGPTCGHGNPGGTSPHPITGEPLCPQCRRGLPATTNTPNPVEVYRRIYQASHHRDPSRERMTTIGQQRIDLNQHGIPDAALAGAAANAALADQDLVTHLRAERERASA